MFTRKVAWLVLALASLLMAGYADANVISLDSEIGPAGTLAQQGSSGAGYAPIGAGDAVNYVGNPFYGPYYSGGPTINFTTIFPDGYYQSRMDGQVAGTPTFAADYGWNSAVTEPLKFDTNNDGTFDVTGRLASAHMPTRS